MKKSRIHSYTVLGISLLLSLAVVAIVGCGGNNSSSSNPTTGTVNTYLSDPPTPTCSDNFAGVYVTITEVDANLNANAGPNDSGWQTLVKLSTPKQVNLMTLYPSKDNPDFCGTLYMLSKQQLPPGKYQQIRLILMANNASGTVSDNACTTGGFNCVVPKNPDGSDGTPSELQLPSEAQTGIKIPASQIANGGLTVTAGQNTDFNIDINSCASIVQQGNGTYLLKPVLHAGEVSLNQSVISGKVVESSASSSPSPGSPVENAIVLLEQPVTENSTTTDRVVMVGSTDSDGTFSFCPLAATTSNVDIVVTGQTTESGTTPITTTYNPTVLFNVPIGSNVGNIPLYAETTTGSGTGLVATSPAAITGTISTAGSSGAAAGTVQISALQQVTNGSSNINLTIPVFGAMSVPSEFTTTSTSSCATSSADCVAYSLQVPASSPAMATYSSSSYTFTPPDNDGQATYTVNAVADGSDSLLACSTTSTTSNSFTVKSGDTAAAATGTGVTVVEPSLAFSFTGCQ